MDTKPSKVRKIKTIRARLSNVETFDEEVNEAIAAGWYLVKRYTIPRYNEEANTLLIAELQRFDDYDE